MDLKIDYKAIVIKRVILPQGEIIKGEQKTRSRNKPT